jgi:HK97 family phage prohead protease
VTDFFPDANVRPVEGHDDIFAVRWDFTLQGKALEDGATAPVVTELEDGDLLIEGYAAVWEGDDRQGENFAPGAFANGIDRFLQGQAALCYHHQHDKCLGKVLDLREEGKGLKMKARVDGAIKDHPVLGTIYKQIKKGTYNGLSTFGYFTRGLVENARKIVDVDLTEISVTPVPVHPGTSLAVVAGKALVSDLKSEHVTVPDFPEDEIRDEDFMWAQESISTLDRIFERLGKRNSDNSTTDQVTVL